MSGRVLISSVRIVLFTHVGQKLMVWVTSGLTRLLSFRHQLNSIIEIKRTTQPEPKKSILQKEKKTPRLLHFDAKWFRLSNSSKIQQLAQVGKFRLTNPWQNLPLVSRKLHRIRRETKKKKAIAFISVSRFVLFFTTGNAKMSIP